MNSNYVFLLIHTLIMFSRQVLVILTNIVNTKVSLLVILSRLTGKIFYLPTPQIFYTNLWPTRTRSFRSVGDIIGHTFIRQGLNFTVA